MYVIDACVYVSSIRPREPAHQASPLFLDQVRLRHAPVKCPETLVAEVAGVLGKGTKGSAYALQYALALRRLPGHQVFAVDRQLADLAAGVGAQQRLSGMDAIYAALARREGARLVILDGELLDRAPTVSQATTPADELALFTGKSPRS
jgi:predicted nucleic acid-binding protein